MQQLRFPPSPSKKIPTSLTLLSPSPHTHPPLSLITNGDTKETQQPFLLLLLLPLLLNSMSSPPSPSSPTSYLTHLGLGYSIAIALAFLVLLSTLILSSYLCCNRNRNRNNNRHNNNHPTNNPHDGVVLPRIIFVAEGEEEDEEGRAAVGLEQNVINSYPRFQFSRESNSGVGQNTTCSICLCEYKDSEIMRMMPECRHYFHVWCLDAWLRLNGSCPVCRNSPLPTPLSTPLQEVVPLSQYAADRRRR